MADRLERIAGFFVLAWGWKRILWAFLAGAVSALAMPPLDLFAILFVTLPILVWLMDATASDAASNIVLRFWQGFKTGWWFGFGYLLAGLWWIGNAVLLEAEQFGWLLPLAVLALPAGLAIFYGLGTGLARLLWKEDWRRVLALAGGLALAEYGRGTLLTGFPWNTLGYGAMTNVITMQKASLIGLYGVTAICLPLFALGALFAPRIASLKARLLLPLAIGVILIGGDIGFGWYRLNANPTRFEEDVKLRIVQPAIDQSQKWLPEIQDENFKRLLDLSTSSPPGSETGLSDIDLLIWPETAFPFILTERRDALAALGAMLPDGTLLAAGAVRVEPAAPGQSRERVFNAVYTINSAGEIVGAADKVHLVPFGEFLPFQELAEAAGLEQLTKLPGGFEPGTSRTILEAGKAGSFLPLICYEIIFPGKIVPPDQQPSWILNVTNDAWFGLTPGPYQHAQQARIRGIEEGLPVVRAANSGISFVSDAWGRILQSTPLGARAVVDSELPLAAGGTFYSRYRELPFALILAAYFLILLIPRRLA